MDWLMEWVRNLAYFFIFLSLMMQIAPGGEEKKYIRFFMGMMLLLVFLRPLLKWKDMDQFLEREVIEDAVKEAHREIVEAGSYWDVTGTEYVKNACARQMEEQIRQLMESYGYEVKKSQVIFFEGDKPEIKEITVALVSQEDTQREGKEFLEKKLENVYNLPPGNINISIQG